MSRPFQTDGTLSSRYECKYLVPFDALPALRAFIRPFTRPDRYAARRDDHRYPISSLYLDSEDLSLYQTTVQGRKNRYKLRVRSYSDRPEHPVFFEVKKRMNDIVRKSRASIDRQSALGYLRCPYSLIGRDHDRTEGFEEFRNLAQLTGARSVLRVRYMREAHESIGGDPVRVTFDSDLMHAVTPHANLGHDGPDWHRTPVSGVIVEIKFTERHPSWVPELIRAFQLQRQSVAKYVLSIDRSVELGNYQASLRGGRAFWGTVTGAPEKELRAGG